MSRDKVIWQLSGTHDDDEVRVVLTATAQTEGYRIVRTKDQDFFLVGPDARVLAAFVTMEGAPAMELVA